MPPRGAGQYPNAPLVDGAHGGFQVSVQKSAPATRSRVTCEAYIEPSRFLHPGGRGRALLDGGGVQRPPQRARRVGRGARCGRGVHPGGRLQDHAAHERHGGAGQTLVAGGPWRAAPVQHIRQLRAVSFAGRAALRRATRRLPYVCARDGQRHRRGPPRTLFALSVCAALTLNATGQCRVSLSLR